MGNRHQMRLWVLLLFCVWSAVGQKSLIFAGLKQIINAPTRSANGGMKYVCDGTINEEWTFNFYNGSFSNVLRRMIYHQGFANVVAVSPDVNITSVSNSFSGSANQITIRFLPTPIVPQMTARFYVTYTAPDLAQSIDSGTDELFWIVDNTRIGIDFFNVTTQFVIPSNINPSSVSSDFDSVRITRDNLTANVLVTRSTSLVPFGSSWPSNAKYPTLTNGQCRTYTPGFYSLVIATPIGGTLVVGLAIWWCCRGGCCQTDFGELGNTTPYRVDAGNPSSNSDVDWGSICTSLCESLGKAASDGGGGGGD
eukprot:TRINITY_DN933_c0_g1_i1.p1 TRINITY_DN933_c0_g1~~TRINITY_DN933_c0_g1_i1.p1  ORF type:complete len:309 (+),score=40.42 TRINITY_DN933_c0_g1_i1:46-972(+)